MSAQRSVKNGYRMKNKKVYISLILSYLVVFLIPLVLNLINLEDIARSTQDNICSSALENLDHAVKTIDTNMEEIDTVVQKLSGNSVVRYIATQMEKKDKYVQISKILSCQNFMKSMPLQNFVDEYYLYFYNNDMMISPDHIFLDKDTCKYFFQYDGMDWDEWAEKMGENYNRYFFPEAMTKQNVKDQNMLIYAQSLVTGTGVKGTFIFPISSESFANILQDVYMSYGGWAYIQDRDGRVLLRIPSQQGEFEEISKESLVSEEKIQEAELNGKKVEVIRSSAENAELDFVVVLPQEYITSQINDAQKKNIILMLAAIALGIVAILEVSLRRGRKIQNIVQMLVQVDGNEEESVKGDAMAYISDSLRQLIDHNTDLKENFKKQEPVVQELLVERLLRGTGDISEADLEEYGISFGQRKSLVIAYRIEEKKTIDTVPAVDTAIYMQILRRGIEEILTGEKYTCHIDINREAMVCSMEKGMVLDKKSVQKSLEQLCGIFWEGYGIAVQIAVGCLCDDIKKISKSYDQVDEILQYGVFSDKHVFFYEDYLDKREYYYFPVSLEERLVNAVCSGNRDSVHDQLQEVYQINVLERNISPSMLHFLINDLQCAVFKAMHGLCGHVEIDEDEIQRRLEELNRENDILLRLNLINNIFWYLCDKVQEETNESNEEQKQKIEQYIWENFASSDLSLTKIANDFGYASTYFSKIFKELFHENFVTYLERVRIEKVCELLLDGGVKKLEIIADETGYNSVYVMRTAFKRVKGMTPNEYRKLNVKKGSD